MRGRDVEFREFVDQRSGALWRTATLLEIDASDAAATLLAALATARRSWGRTSDPEGTTRSAMHQRAARRHRPDLDGPPSAHLDVMQARRDLTSLTHRQRLLLVLTRYEGLTASEAAAVLGMDAGDVPAVVEVAEQTLRERSASAGSVSMLTLLDAAALTEPPSQLAERAASAPRERNRRPLVLVLGVAVVVAVALAATAWPWQADSDAASVSDLGMPATLPTGHDLPTLREQPIDRASTAYVVSGIPIVTDAATGAGRLVFERDPSPDWFDNGEPGVTQLFVHARWSEAVLSPDGEWLVLVQLLRSEAGVSSRTFLVHVPAATVEPLHAIHPKPGRVAGITRSAIAWSPESDSFACACRKAVAIVTVPHGAVTDVSVLPTSVRADAVAGGFAGLALRDDERGWWIVNRTSAVVETLTRADALAMTYYHRVLYLTVDSSVLYALGSDYDVDGGRCTLWDLTFTDPTPIEPFPERDGWRCTPVTAQSGADGIVLILQPDVVDPRGEPLDVVYVRDGGRLTSLGQFPGGTTVASVAAQLVG